jgi:hypothetical protein
VRRADPAVSRITGHPLGTQTPSQGDGPSVADLGLNPFADTADHGWRAGSMGARVSLQIRRQFPTTARLVWPRIEAEPMGYEQLGHRRLSAIRSSLMCSPGPTSSVSTPTGSPSATTSVTSCRAGRAGLRQPRGGLQTLVSATGSTLSICARWGSPGQGRTGPGAYPETLVGTDSCTAMVNGLGVLDRGFEAEAALLGQ